MSSVTVFCPNARRQPVKVQPSTKIVDILEEVCKKQGYSPNEHELVYQKKSLDLTLTFRLSGIPNNAVVDLKMLDSGPRHYENVTISLQLEDGSRLTPTDFKSDSTSLFSIIENYSRLNPELIDLKKALDENLSQENNFYATISYLNEQIIGLKQLKLTFLKDLGLTKGRYILKFLNRKIDQDQFNKLMTEFDARQAKKMKLDEIYKQKQEELKQTSDIVPQPVPVTQTTPKVEEHLSKKPKIQETMEIESKQPEVAVQNQFANFKFPEETRGQNLNDVNELAEIERVSKQPCDRMSLLFSLEDNLKMETEISEPGDDFYDITVKDLRVMLSDLKRNQNEEVPLMTKQMRELEKDRKAMKYSKIAIRIAFKNRMVLQGLFRPKELLSELYKFVKGSLAEQNNAEEVDFYLFSSPPKKILNQMKMTLFDADLCPAVLIYFKNKTDTVPIFKSDIPLKRLIEADEEVQIHVHSAIREINHEGLDWIEKDQKMVQNILKTNNLMPKSSGGQVNQPRRENKNDDQVKNKLERFLKGSKK
ncbi:Tether containing UBX domain for GLUT4 [Brachionus plicatilis]|uniref:Tether containing UBX domain for GLUT4 n=1 Tax=Brachionus plicatilis TaxID=10195 RepID=A0A3M7P7J9_BRAPC|nr:Tether containing UBX domain for GLUT4 [Brachionus plicatilis]